MKRSRASLAVVLLAMLGGATLAAGPGRAVAAEEPHYEMTTYYVGLLYRGPAWTPEVTPETQAIQKGHMENIGRLAASGKLILAGPFSDDTALRGMFVFQVASLEEATALCDTDPAVKAGRLKVELHPWFSAKGIRIDPPTGKEAGHGGE